MEPVCDGRAWRMDFRLFLWVLVFLDDPYISTLILCTYLAGVLSVICEFELKTFYFGEARTFLKLENSFEVL